MSLGPATVACELQRLGPHIFKGPGSSPAFPSLWGGVPYSLGPSFPLKTRVNSPSPDFPPRAAVRTQKLDLEPHQVPRATSCPGYGSPESCTLCPSPAHTCHLPYPLLWQRVQHRGYTDPSCHFLHAGSAGWSREGPAGLGQGPGTSQAPICFCSLNCMAQNAPLGTESACRQHLHLSKLKQSLVWQRACEASFKGHVQGGLWVLYFPTDSISPQ